METINNIINNLSKETESPVPIVLFGSSNTAIHYNANGRFTWGDWLHLNLRMNSGKHFVVINSGIGGNTTNDLLDRIDRDVLYFRPKIVILTIGGNDCIRNIGIEEYKRNLGKIIKKVKETGSHIVMQTYYCFNYKDLNTGNKENDIRIAKEFPLYMKEFKNTAKEHDLPVVDQYSYFEPLYIHSFENYKKIMIDNLHLNYIGNFIMGNFISRQFGLPESVFPDDAKEVYKHFLDMIDDYNKIVYS